MKRILIMLLVAASAAGTLLAAQLTVLDVKADRATCVYGAGETATVTVRATDGKGKALMAGRLSYTVDNFGARQVERRTVDLAKENPFTVKVTKANPGFMRLNIKSATKGLVVARNPGVRQDGLYVYGIAFDPTRIQPGTPEPADFDAFWANAIRELDATVPLDLKLEPLPDQLNGEMRVWRISFASYGGRRVWGWLSKPKETAKGPFPVFVRVPGAGIGLRGPQVRKGAITLAMNVHSYPQPEGTGKAADAARDKAYKAQDAKFGPPNGVVRYCLAGIHKSREDYFYYASILGINRAINWLAKDPDCDLKHFTYNGTSQGGGFGLILTALNGHFTRSCIFVPAMTDLLGFRQEERQSGWPRLIEGQKSENRAAAEKNAPYFCGVNFARRIHCPIRFVVDFSDCTCAPHAVYSAFNVCPSKDKKIEHGIAYGHDPNRRFYSKLGAWEAR